MATRIGGPRTNIPVTSLKGEAIDPQNKVVETRSHKIEMSSFDNGMVLPDFKLSRRTVDDPEARTKLIDVPQTRLDQVKTGADFKKLLEEVMTASDAFINPDRQALMVHQP
jgi:hypothetical protein